MLAMISPRMEPPRAPRSPSNTLLRQPSAEDLDAAHQLVSSARGVRDGSVESRSLRSATETEDGNIIGNRRTSPEILQNGQDRLDASAHEKQNNEINGLGQSCRCVNLQFQV